MKLTTEINTEKGLIIISIIVFQMRKEYKYLSGVKKIDKNCRLYMNL